MAQTVLQELLDRVGDMSPEAKAAVTKDAVEATRHLIWVPNPGPQLDAWNCEADELFMGGSAGGGKSDLSIGLALTQHKHSLILRRFTDDARSLAERAMDIVGSRDGFNGQQLRLRVGDNRVIDFGGCKEETDKQRFKGTPHDLIFFDEIADFLESQYEFIIAWNRSADPGQRCRVVAAGNPPTTSEGIWIIYRWGAWLLPDHPNPAKDGELRWYTTGSDGNEIEVDGRGPHLIGGEQVIARSRTFIRAWLSDNPDLSATDDYKAVLAGLPAELRDAYRDGKFDASLKDNPHQVIPAAWIRAAQDRWEPTPPYGIPMCAIGVDVAQGGSDDTVFARRHDGWYAPLIAVPGRETPDGPSVAGRVLAIRRDGAKVIVDMGGGYGGSTYDHLKANEIPVLGYKGAEKSIRRTSDRQLRFVNKRAEAYWKFREALEPGQFQGSPIALPADPVLVSDLTAPTFEVGPNGIKITPKKDLTKRLGRSPDKGDAVVMAWFDGARASTHSQEWRPDQRVGGQVWKRHPQVDFGPRHHHLGTSNRTSAPRVVTTRPR